MIHIIKRRYLNSRIFLKQGKANGESLVKRVIQRAEDGGVDVGSVCDGVRYMAPLL